MLFFIDYFKHAEVLPKEYMHSVLTQSSYIVFDVILLQTKIEITSPGVSRQMFHI